MTSPTEEPQVVNEQQAEFNTASEAKESGAATTETAEVKEAELSEAPAHDPLAKAEAELTEWKDKYLRLYSEFENFRRRTQREKADLILTAGEKVIASLLPTLDDLERAEKATASATDINSVREGMALIANKLRSTLEHQGLKPMNAAGTAFNPDLHEAITQVPAPTEAQKNTVLDEVERGYLLHEKPIRFAKVVIGS